MSELNLSSHRRVTNIGLVYTKKYCIFFKHSFSGEVVCLRLSQSSVLEGTIK